MYQGDSMGTDNLNKGSETTGYPSKKMNLDNYHTLYVNNWPKMNCRLKYKSWNIKLLEHRKEKSLWSRVRQSS